MTRPKSTRWAVATLAMSAFLLLSMGGAIAAAPVTLPLLVVAVRRDALAGWLRGAAVAVAGLTVIEVVWAITYVTAGEAKPWIWLLPAVAGIAAATALAATRPVSSAPDAA